MNGINIGICTSNAGVIISRGGQKKLTCAAHGWDAVEDKLVYHGESLVGHIDEILGEDIGLIELLVPALRTGSLTMSDEGLGI